MTITIPEYSAEVLRRLEAAGYESYAVGGCVRDALLGVTPHDWDVTTAARPDQVEAVFADERVLETGLAHGTVTVLTAAGPVEITTFRTEGRYSDGRRPDSVRFVDDVHEDLLRRDFTVNAMAYSPARGLRDDFGGAADLAAGVLRCVGDANARLREDSLRILRALRFAARYGFTVAPETDAALRENRSLLANVSAERIYAELKGILTAPGAGRMMLAYPEIFFTLFPEMEPMAGFDQCRPDAHPYDVWERTARTVDAAPAESVVRLAAFFHDCGKPAVFTRDPKTGLGRFYGHQAEGARMAEAMLRRLRADNAARRSVTALVESHDRFADQTRRSIGRLLARLGEEDLRRLFALGRADASAHTSEVCRKCLGQIDRAERLLDELLSEARPIAVRDLAVDGNDLLSAGVEPGPAMGALLRSLLAEVMDETLPNEREALLRRVWELTGP